VGKDRTKYRVGGVCRQYMITAPLCTNGAKGRETDIVRHLNMALLSHIVVPAVINPAADFIAARASVERDCSRRSLNIGGHRDHYRLAREGLDPGQQHARSDINPPRAA